MNKNRIKNMCLFATVFVILICIVILPNVSKAKETIQKYFVIDEDEYEYISFEFTEGDGIYISYEVKVTSGPSIDIYFVDYIDFQKYRCDDEFYYKIYLSEKNTKYAKHSDIIKEHDTYYLIIDNTDVGTEPPWNGINDVAYVSVFVEYEITHPTNENNSDNTMIIVGIIVGIIIVSVLIVFLVIMSKKERKQLPPQQLPPQQLPPQQLPPQLPPQT